MANNQNDEGYSVLLEIVQTAKSIQKIISVFEFDFQYFKSLNSKFSLLELRNDHTKLMGFLATLSTSKLSYLKHRISINSGLSDNTENESRERIASISSSVFTLHKTDSTEETNEDAFFAKKENTHIPLGGNAKTFAVSDGATSSPDARTWANMLVESSEVFDSDADKFVHELIKLKKEWAYSWEKKKAEKLNPSAGWWAESSLNKPNAATYCSLTLEPTSETTINWRSIAVGDSCLFQFRDGELIKSFPISDVSEFTDRPTLVRSSQDDLTKSSLKTYEGKSIKGDTFLLATDAVAEWIFRHLSSNSGFKSDVLNGCLDDKMFATIVDMERSLGRMKDDDSTLVVIGVR